jgi:predicted N-acetyltransferase YhbS
MIKKLNENEADLIREIDRAEDITSSYHVKNGKLVKYCHEHIAGGWNPNELEDIVQRTSELIRNNGIVLGYFDKTNMIGVISLGSLKLTFPNNCVLMDIFYVSSGYRGKGIGQELFKAIKGEAITFGLSGIYISATPTSGTVDFYLRSGCKLSKPNQGLLRKEPDDIHLLYDL